MRLRQREARLVSLLLGALLTTVLSPAPAAAEPCCVARLCLDLTPAECSAQSGIEGYCRLGLACGAPSCDAALIQPLFDVRAVKQDTDLRMLWTADPEADTYFVSEVSDKGELPGCETAGTPVQGNSPSTIPEALWSGVVAGGLSLYCVRPDCSETSPQTGACCRSDTECVEDETPGECREAGGIHLGVGTTCAGVSCSVANVTPCLAGGNVVYFDGDPGDWVHPGIDTITDADFRPFMRPSGVWDTIRIDVEPTNPGQGLWWDLEFSTEMLGIPFDVGIYEDAQRAPFAEPGHPGLNITGDGRGCNTLTGRFKVHEFVRTGEDLDALTASWEQHCEGGPAQLRGCVHYESPRGACCTSDTDCTDDLSEAACRLGSGLWMGEGSTCAGMEACAVGDPTPCLVGGNVVYFDGDPGDYIHPGSDTIVDAQFTPTLIPTADPQTIKIDVDPTDPGQGAWWWLDFSSRELGEPLSVRWYENAQREPFADPGHPGLNIHGDGRGCNILTGRFHVYELVLAGSVLQSFTATWEQHCEDGLPQLRGCVHFEQ